MLLLYYLEGLPLLIDLTSLISPEMAAAAAVAAAVIKQLANMDFSCLKSIF